MPSFVYRGFRRSGEPVKGLLEAASAKAAREALLAEGVLAEAVEPSGRSARRGVGGGRTGEAVRADLYAELAAMARSGLPFAQSLAVAREGAAAEGLREPLADLLDRVRGGQDVASALTEALGGVTPFETTLLAIGERTGDLARSLDELSRFLQSRREFRERVQSALMYPLLVLGLTVVLLVVMTTGLLPLLDRLLADARVDLPPLTRAVFTAGRVMSWALPAALVLGGGLWWLGRSCPPDPAREEARDRVRLARRGWGTVRRALASHRFTHTLAILLDGGAGLPEAVRLAGRATGHPSLERRLEEAARAVEQGRSLAESLAGIEGLAPNLAEWVGAGEASGRLAELLRTAAERYRAEWERRTSRMLGLLAPALLVGVGLLVLIVALAVLWPILNLSRGLGL